MSEDNINQSNSAASNACDNIASDKNTSDNMASNNDASGRKDNKELIRTLKFIGFSVSAGVIEILMFTLLNEVFHLPYWGSYLTALVCSVLWNFTFNRKFTFQSANNVPVAMAKVFAFYCVFTPLTTLLEHFLTTKLGWNEYVVTLINMLLNFVTEYFYQRYFVFVDSIDTNDVAKKKENKSREESGN